MTNREIDVLIAQHCMGWRWVKHSQNAPGVFARYRWLNPGPLRPWMEESSVDEPIPVSQVTLPYFSSEAGPSKQLRNRMRELGWLCRVHAHCDVFSACYAAPPETGHDTYRQSQEIDDESEEMAVALAALVALGVPNSR